MNHKTRLCFTELWNFWEVSYIIEWWTWIINKFPTNFFLLLLFQGIGICYGTNWTILFNQLNITRQILKIKLHSICRPYLLLFYICFVKMMSEWLIQECCPCIVFPYFSYEGILHIAENKSRKKIPDTAWSLNCKKATELEEVSLP